MKRWLSCGMAVALVALPSVAAACPVCFSPSDDANRMAYNLSTLGLTLLPLGLIAGIGLWLWRRAKAVEAPPVAASERSL